MNETMYFERQKALITAIAQLEIALNTFYNEKENLERLSKITDELKQLKIDYLD